MKKIINWGIVAIIGVIVSCGTGNNQKNLDKKLFAYENLSEFNLKHSVDSLVEVTDPLILAAIKELTGHEPYKGDDWGFTFYFLSKENRLDNYNEFTVLYNNPEEYSIFYIILDKDAKAKGFFKCATSSGAGDYTEEGSGKFTGKLEYTLKIIGDGDAESDSESEGYHIEEEYIYIINSDGTVSEKKDTKDLAVNNDDNDVINDIRDWYKEITTAVKNNSLKTKTKNAESEYYNFYYNKENELVLIENKGGVDGDFLYEYYFRNGKLFFVYQYIHDTFVEEQGEDGKSENRIYFNNNQIIRFLDKNKNEQEIDKSLSKSFQKDIERLLAIEKEAVEAGEEEGAPTKVDFSGEYHWEAGEKKDGVYANTFGLNIKQDKNGKITGGYHAWANYGHRLDGGQEAYECKIEGEAKLDVAYITFTSCYSGDKGEAELSYNDGKWNWVVNSENITAYCPWNAELKKK